MNTHWQFHIDSLVLIAVNCLDGTCFVDLQQNVLDVEVCVNEMAIQVSA